MSSHSTFEASSFETTFSCLPASGSGLANSFRKIKLSSRRFTCARSLSVHVVILAQLQRVKLSDRQATLAAKRRSELRHHLLRDASTSDILVVSGFPYCRSGLHFWVHPMGMYLASAAGFGSTSTRPSCKLHGFASIPNSVSQFQRSFLFRLRMLRHDTTAALLLTMCSPILVLKPSQQPSSQFTASFCCGPVVLCGLNRICSPNTAIF